jgi:ribosomal protein S1
MNDSREMNEKDIVTGTITCIVNGEAKVAFDSQPGEGAVIPLSKLSGEIAVGNVVKLRLENKGGNTVITEILSNKRPSTPSEAQQAVLSEADDKDVVEGVALAIENDDVLVNIGLNTDVKIPLSRFTDIGVGDKVKMRVESVDGKIVV